MNIRKVFVLCMWLGAAGSAIAQVNIPNPMEPGNSIDSAVRLIAPNDIMLERSIKRWLRVHYPNWNADPHEFMMVGDERYAVVYITSANSPGRRIYFRVKRNPGEADDDAGFGFPN